MILKPQILSLFGLLLLVLQVTAYWRLPCMGVVGRGLIDPIVSPGNVSAHLHSLKGGSAISLSSSADDLLKSSCTSCQIEQDKSAYWSPQMYFFDNETNEYEMVPEVSGHLTYYKYVPHTIANGTYTMPIAIPNGMKMLSGNPFRRNMTIPNPDPPLPWSGQDATQDALQQKAIGFNCLSGDVSKIEGTLQRHFLPSKEFLETNCPWGIRLEVLFPTCWDGINLSSKDLTSHLAYGSAGANGGSCPKGYDTVIMQLLFETIYPTVNFIGRNGYYVFAQGDPTGFGYHGDALIAWEGTTQQDAVRDCGDPVLGPYSTDGVVSECPHFKLVSQDDQAACSIQDTAVAVKANFKVEAHSLPGNNPVQYGPQQATHPGSGAVVTPVPVLPSTIIPSIIPVPSSSFNSADPYGNQSHRSTQTSNAAAAKVNVQITTSSPAVTPDPVAAPTPVGDVTLNTVTYTSKGAVYEVVNVEVVSTTTVYPSPTALKKRSEHSGHFHRHAHRRRH